MKSKTLATTVFVISLIFLTACGGETRLEHEIGTTTSTPSRPAAAVTTQAKDPEPDPPKETDFKAGLAFDPISFEDRLPEDERPALVVLEKHLTALVKHDYKAFKAGFVDEKLADTLGFYYGDPLQYRFTGIEELESFASPTNQVHIYVLGERLDTETDTVERVKLMYAIRQSDTGEWSISTID